MPFALERELANRLDLDDAGPVLVFRPDRVDVGRAPDPRLIVPKVELGLVELPGRIVLAHDLEDDGLKLAPAPERGAIVLRLGQLAALERPQLVGREER